MLNAYYSINWSKLEIVKLYVEKCTWIYDVNHHTCYTSLENNSNYNQLIHRIKPASHFPSDFSTTNLPKGLSYHLILCSID